MERELYIKMYTYIYIFSAKYIDILKDKIKIEVNQEDKYLKKNIKQWA